LPGSPVASDPAAIAQQLLQRPEGQRVLCFWDVLYELADHPLDRIQTPDGKPTEIRSPFMDHGIEATAQRVNSILAGIKRAGATVDVLVLDYERGFAWDPRFASLDNDPRWIGLARELGFEDLRGMDPARIARWNEVMGRYFDDAIARSTDQPLQSVFPGARLANFDSFASTPMAPVIGTDGAPFLRASVTDRNGTLVGLGSHDSSPFFGVLLPTTAQQRVDGVNPIGQDAFAATRLELHRSRSMRKPAGRSQMPWIAPKSLDAGAFVAQAEPGTAAPMRSTPYWDEMVLQLGLHGADDFLYWNPEGKLAPQAPVAALAEDHQALDGLLEELNRNLGQQPGDSVYREQPGFDDRIIATGRDDGESIVWRFTFDPGIESARVFFTDGTSVVVNREADRPGAWIAHPKSKSLVFDADNTAPVFEVVAARTNGTSSASTKSPDGATAPGSGDATGTKGGADAGSTVASGGSGGSSGGTSGATGSTGSTGGGSTLATGSGGSGGDVGASTGATGSSSAGGNDGSQSSARAVLIAQLTSETRQRAGEAMATIFPSRRTSDWTGGLSYRRDRWAAMLSQAGSAGSLSSYLAEVNGQGAAAAQLDPALYIRPQTLAEIHPQLLDARAAGAGQNRLACALAYADVNQSALLQQRGVVLAIAAAQTSDPALVARANDMLRAFVGHNPLQRPGTTLTSSAMVMPEGGDGVWLATAWGIDGIVGMMSALGDRVPEDLRSDLEVLLRREVRNICVDWADQRPWYVRVRAFNSNQWMEPAVALIRACLFLGDPELLPAYNLGVESLAASLAVHGSDGAYLEGFSYAAQSLGTVFDIVDDMRAIGDQRCSDFGFTSNNWRWLMHTVMPGGYVVNCYDSGRSILPDWGRAAPMPHFGIVATGSEPEALQNMAWMFPQGRGDLPGLRYATAVAGLGGQASMTLPTFAYFPSQQVATWRSAWERPAEPSRAFGVWVRGGALLDGHAHRDQGQVSVYAGERPILIDCGSDYSHPNQEAMLAAAAGHGIMQVGALSPRHKAISAPMVVSRLDDQAGSVLVDSTAAYAGVVSCVRTVQWDVSGRVNFGDTVAFRDQVPAGTEVYRFHTGSTLPLEISGGGTSWQVGWEGATMAISADRAIVVGQAEWPDAVLPGKMHRVITIRSVDALESMAMTSMLEVSMR
ncbi:MAG: heparinase II/III family protein, partial [Planctomycetes bacterium]|nr:heparinase II/III family protein [Planctomycetota bacterium]